MSAYTVHYGGGGIVMALFLALPFHIDKTLLLLAACNKVHNVGGISLLEDFLLNVCVERSSNYIVHNVHVHVHVGSYTVYAVTFLHC